MGRHEVLVAINDRDEVMSRRVEMRGRSCFQYCELEGALKWLKIF